MILGTLPYFVRKLIRNANFGDGGGAASDSGGEGTGGDGSGGDGTSGFGDGFGGDGGGGPAQTGDPNTSDPGPGPVGGGFGNAMGAATPFDLGLVAGAQPAPDFNADFSAFTAPAAPSPGFMESLGPIDANTGQPITATNPATPDQAAQLTASNITANLGGIGLGTIVGSLLGDTPAPSGQPAAPTQTAQDPGPIAPGTPSVLSPGAQPTAEDIAANPALGPNQGNITFTGGQTVGPATTGDFQGGVSGDGTTLVPGADFTSLDFAGGAPSSLGQTGLPGLEGGVELADGTVVPEPGGTGGGTTLTPDQIQQLFSVLQSQGVQLSPDDFNQILARLGLSGITGGTGLTAVPVPGVTQGFGAAGNVPVLGGPFA